MQDGCELPNVDSNSTMDINSSDSRINFNPTCDDTESNSDGPSTTKVTKHSKRQNKYGRKRSREPTLSPMQDGRELPNVDSNSSMDINSSDSRINFNPTCDEADTESNSDGPSSTKGTKHSKPQNKYGRKRSREPTLSPEQQDCDSTDINASDSNNSNPESAESGTEANDDGESTNVTKHSDQIAQLQKSGTSGVKTSTKKPYRPCFFCGKLQSKLSLHLKRKHSEEESVKNALSLPMSLQQRAFDKIRKDGIFKANQLLMSDKTLTEAKRQTLYHKERRQGEKKHFNLLPV
ncbi:dentin sialophosphoprotein-like [Argopecten irradians]|uniref:dentin sialophosphoprotein-like n=1 Tax=Argopecten irradians TaxID=31199 RepID=UPI0037182174